MADDTNVLLAIANLRTEVLQQLTAQATTFRDRLENIERRTSLEIRENVIKIWERIERIQQQIFEAKADTTQKAAEHETKTATKTATDYRAMLLVAGGVIVNIGLMVFQYVFHIKG